MWRHEQSCHLEKRKGRWGHSKSWMSAHKYMWYSFTLFQPNAEVICPSVDRNTTWLRQIGDSQPVPWSSNSRYYSNMKTVLWKHTNTILGRIGSLCFVLEFPARICSYVIWLVGVWCISKCDIYNSTQLNLEYYSLSSVFLNLRTSLDW